MRKSYIIVHGEKSLRNGDMHPAYKSRLNAVLNLIKYHTYDEILITGGYTRDGQVSEAEIGYKYLKPKTNLPIHLEKQAHTTIENVLFTHQHEQCKHEHIQSAVVITSSVRVPRVRYLYKKHWPQLYERVSFIGTQDHYFPLYFLLEYIYWMFDILDPKERYVIKLAKCLFRNACWKPI